MQLHSKALQSHTELRESVAECLTELGFTYFAAAIQIGVPDLSSRLASNDEEFTVFALTNDNIIGYLSPSLPLTHILDEVVRNSHLRSFSVFRPLHEGTLLHVTDVHSFTSSFVFTEVYL